VHLTFGYFYQTCVQKSSRLVGFKHMYLHDSRSLFIQRGSSTGQSMTNHVSLFTHGCVNWHVSQVR